MSNRKGRGRQSISPNSASRLPLAPRLANFLRRDVEDIKGEGQPTSFALELQSALDHDCMRSFQPWRIGAAARPRGRGVRSPSTPTLTRRPSCAACQANQLWRMRTTQTPAVGREPAGTHPELPRLQWGPGLLSAFGIELDAFLPGEFSPG
jgi:hypothetical protein